MNQQQQLAIFREWMQRHRGVLMKVVRSFSVDPADRDDLFQEISFQLWNSVTGFHEQVAATTWIYRVSLYTAIGWSKKEKRLDQRERDLVAPDLVKAPDATHDSRLDWLYDQISRLDELDRSLTLLLLDGFSYQEMSDTLGISISNVGVKINRIKQWLIEEAKKGRGNGL